MKRHKPGWFSSYRNKGGLYLRFRWTAGAGRKSAYLGALGGAPIPTDALAAIVDKVGRFDYSSETPDEKESNLDLLYRLRASDKSWPVFHAN